MNLLFDLPRDMILVDILNIVGCREQVTNTCRAGRDFYQRYRDYLHKPTILTITAVCWDTSYIESGLARLRFSA